MNKLISVVLVAMLAGCVAPASYRKDLKLSAQDKDEAACHSQAGFARNAYFPQNAFLNMQARAEQFELCMRSKGYARAN